MIYVCSDIHGDFQIYNKIINKITSNDKLYILGDVIDRKDDGIKIIQDIMKRDNVELILGNHEWFLLTSILFNWDKNCVDTWTDSRNGGLVTMKSLLNLENDVYNSIVNFLKSCKLAKRLVLNDKVINLIHGSYDIRIEGLYDKSFNEIAFDICNGNITKGSIVFDILWKSPLKSYSLEGYKDDEFYVHGHVPIVTNKPLVIDNNILFIDGGAVFGGSQFLYNLTEGTFEIIK